MDVRLSKQIKMFAREHGDQSHVSFTEGTYEDTVVVQSRYEGVLLEMADRLEDEGYALYYDVDDNRVWATEPEFDDGFEGFQLIACVHANHPNYA